MLDYQNSVEQMTAHQQNNMITYQPSHSHHHQQIPPNSDNYFSYPIDSSVNTRQQFALNPAPLAALHSMADMKTSPSTSSPSDPAIVNYNPTTYYSMKQCIEAATATPHGITDILSRPDLQAQLQARLGQGVYYNNSCSQANSGSTGLRHNSKDNMASANRSLYHWPNNGQMLPGAGQSPVWHNKHAGMISINGKDGKKKNTRPTFTGSQIFALEKTFEQQKYLAGPERGRLAFALGMSEGQVKVWFQNRRTKWRKRHAADVATTKRRPGHTTPNTQPYTHQHQTSNREANAHDNNIYTNEPGGIGHSVNHNDLSI